MRRVVRMLALVAFLGAGAGTAFAAGHDERGQAMRGRDRPHHGGHGAPEPLTLIGLGTGAAAIGAAAWRKRRKG